MVDENTLSVKWNKKDNDHMINYPRSCDGHLIHDYLFTEQFNSPLRSGEMKPSLVKELEKRGYDLTTLKFQIKRKQGDQHRTNKCK